MAGIKTATNIRVGILDFESFILSPKDKLLILCAFVTKSNELLYINLGKRGQLCFSFFVCVYVFVCVYIYLKCKVYLRLCNIAMLKR